MKKFFAVLLTVAMLLSAAAVAEAADFLGVWYLVELQADGESFSPADFGMSMSLELKEDGTAQADSVMGGDPEAQAGSWTQKGDAIVVTIDDSPVTFTLTDGQLIAADEEMTMVFGREAPEAEIFTPAEPVAAVEADFEGSWTAFKYGYEGHFMDAALVGMDMAVEVKDGSLLLSGFFDSDAAIPMTFADGAYAYSTDDESEMFSAIRLQKLADGNLMLTLTAGGDMVLILAPADAAAEEPAA